MKLKEAIEQTELELIQKYKEVKYKSSEIVIMNRDTTTSYYIKKDADINTLKVVPIISRSSIEGAIEAVKVIFEVKAPRKRKFRSHKEYYKIIWQ